MTSLEFFPTPAWVTQAILPHLDWTDVRTVLDPCAGEGAILAEIQDRGAHLVGLELDDARAARCGLIAETIPCNALELDHWPVADLIVMNPPFSRAQEFCEKALTQSPHVVALMRLAMLESAKRAAFWRAHPADVYVFGTRPSFTANGSTDSAAYGWFVWGPGCGHRWWRLDDAAPSRRRMAPMPHGFGGGMQRSG